MQILIAQENWGHNLNDLTSERDNHNDYHGHQNSRIDSTENVGYYIIVHNDEYADVESPESVESLEWDLEWVEGVDDCGEDDVWANQYKWYASILERTAGIVQQMEYGCDRDLQDNCGRTAVHYATDHSQFEALEFLVSAGDTHDL